MPRILFKCRYLKNTHGSHLSNLVEYVATREGVEKVPDSSSHLSATKNQQRLISEILKTLPDTADLFEYEDYLKNQTRENALEFISVALENNFDLIGKKKNFVDYIANRPRAEKLGSHGLFTDEGVPVVLSRVAGEVSNHSGNVWTNVISLRREDAARLGYDCAKSWQDLIRAQRNVIAENMKIAPENLRWYAAFHNESHHPHLHMIAYSTNPREAYVTKQGIENMRGSLAREIFRQDLLQIYEKQTERRNALTKQSRKTVQDIISQITSGICENKNIEELITNLAEKLKHTSGKKQYGYLKAPLKDIIDQVVDELAKDEKVAELYNSWYEMRNEVLRTYADKLPLFITLSQQKEFKSIKNMVIAEALNIGSHHFIFEPDGEYEVSIDNHDDNADITDDMLQIIDEYPSAAERPSDVYQEDNIFIADLPNEDTSGNEQQEFKHHVRWSDRYKEACEFLYGTGDMEPDFEKALRLYMEEAEAGNALAMHDLGRMFMNGIGVEMNTGAAQEWYAKALTAFMDVESSKSSPYIQYRIGKMHNAGLGTPLDYLEAADWFHLAVARNHKYAQYSLAGLYYHGYGIDQSYENAFDLYRKSARQGNPYASYELAKMYRDGIGTEKNTEKADGHFKEAFTGFLDLEAQSRDDKLQYRLGHMLYTGTGTGKDAASAITYFEKAAKLGNVNAQYMLGRIYLEAGSEHINIEKALQWLGKAAHNGNAPARYAMGKLYLAGSHVEKDVLKAVEMFTKSAEQGNQYAQCQLGKLYLWGEDIPRDINTAIRWLAASADQNNQFAQYTLGKLYLKGEEIEKDIPSAIQWLTASAEQGNQYAQYALGKLYLLGYDVNRDKEIAKQWLLLSAAQGNLYAQFLLQRMDAFKDPSVLFTATRLMHHLGNIFRDEYRTGGGSPLLQVDCKLRKKLMEKKLAQGHAYNDHAPQQSY